MKLFINLFVLLQFSLLTSQAQIIKAAEGLVGTSRNENVQISTHAIDSIIETDSLRIVELTQQLQQMKLNEIMYLEELGKKRTKTQSDSLYKNQQRARIDSLRSVSQGSPLIIEKDTVFTLYASRGAISAGDRVERSKDFIIRLGKTRHVNADSIHILTLESVTEIMYEDKVIISVTKDDALWMNLTVDSLAKDYRKAIIKSVKEIQKKNSLSELFKRIGLLLLVLGIQGLVIYFTNFLYRKLKEIINKKSKLKLKPIIIRNYELLSTDNEARILVWLSNVFRYILILLQLLISIPIIFSIFPQTENLANTLFGYILTPIKKILLSIINYIPNLFTILIIFLCIQYVVKGLRYLAKEIEGGRIRITGFYADWARPTFSIIRFLLYVFMIALVYPYLPGSDSGVFQGISIFVGLIVSLGSSTVIGNIISGLIITYMRPFRMGDRIKINNDVGNVIEKTPLVTRIRTPKNEIITIPNSFVMTSQTTNYSKSATDYGLIIHSSVTIGYDVPWQKVHELLIAAAKDTNNVLKNKEPFVLEISLNDFTVEYQINAYIDDVNQTASTFSDLHTNIQIQFNGANIAIESPMLYSEK